MTRATLPSALRCSGTVRCALIDRHRPLSCRIAEINALRCVLPSPLDRLAGIACRNALTDERRTHLADDGASAAPPAVRYAYLLV